MGISSNAIRLLLREDARRPITGRLLTLGKQDIAVNADELKAILGEFGKDPPKTPVVLSEKPHRAESQFISDDYLFKAIGVPNYDTLDASRYEGASVVYDLNSPRTPWRMKRKWDLIFDGGTIEHVFNLPNALANIFRFLRVGGRIIHVSPSSNHIDHGFYMFSPTLFWDYYTANNFEINTFEVFRYSTSHNSLWDVSKYLPGSLTRVSFGGLDDGLYAIIVIATKTENSTCHVVPQQGVYANMLWRETDEKGNPKFGKGTLDQVLDPDHQGKGLGLKIDHRL